MSWTKITSSQPGRVTGVSLSVVTEHKTKHCSRVFVSIARQLAEAAGIAYGGRVDFFVGEGKDAGRLLIVANPEGGYITKGKRKTGSVRMAAAAPKEFPRAVRTQKCTVVSVDPTGIVFELPWGNQKPESEVMPNDAGAERSSRSAAIPTHDTSPVSARFEKPSPQGDQIAATKAVASVDKLARKANGRFSGKAPPPNAVAAAHAGPISIRSIVEETSPVKPAPEPDLQKPQWKIRDEKLSAVGLDGARAEAPPPPRKPLTYAFEHKSKTIDLEPRHHALAMKLQKAMGKGFLDYQILMNSSGIERVEGLHGAVSALRKKLEPLGLEIGVQPKMGYFMRETAGIVG